MARIPDVEIERLKKEVPIERLVMGFGVELKRHGVELIGTSPFHEDKTPSLVVSPKTNLWHCLGKCNVGGSTIDWVMRTKGVRFRHAVELLRADHPSLAAGEGRVVKKGTTAKLDAPVKAEAGNLAVPVFGMAGDWVGEDWDWWRRDRRRRDADGDAGCGIGDVGVDAGFCG